MQFPTVPDLWAPIGCQYLDAAVSTALTIPATSVIGKSCYVAVLSAQVVGTWIRTDGQAVLASVSGGRLLPAGDHEVVYGREAISKLRVFRDGAGGSLAVEYYVFRPQY